MGDDVVETVDKGVEREHKVQHHVVPTRAQAVVVVEACEGLHVIGACDDGLARIFGQGQFLKDDLVHRIVVL